MYINNSLITVLSLLILTIPCYAEEPNVKLESNFIGDKEQPSVSYFIPWKEIGTPDKLLWNFDSKYDKTLDLVDRQVLLRSIGIYKEMSLEPDLTLAKEN